MSLFEQLLLGCGNLFENRFRRITITIYNKTYSISKNAIQVLYLEKSW